MSKIDITSCHEEGHQDVEWGEYYPKNDLIVIDGKCKCGTQIRETFVPNTRHYKFPDGREETQDIQI